MNSLKFVPENWSGGTAIGPRWQLPGKWSATCSRWIEGIRTSCLPRNSPGGQRLKAFPNREKVKHQDLSTRRLPGSAVADWATEQIPEAHYELFRDWQRTQTQSSATALRSPRQQMDVWFCIGRNLRREAQIALEGILIRSNARSPKRARKTRGFSLDFDLHGSRLSDKRSTMVCHLDRSEAEWRDLGCQRST